MDSLSMASLPWHSREKIGFLAGTAAQYLGWKTLSLDYWQDGGPEKLPYESLPAHYLLKARVESMMNPEADISPWLDEAYRIANDQFQGIFAGHILMEKMLFLRRRGQTAQWEALTKEALELIPMNARSAQRQLLHHILAGGSFDYHPPQQEVTLIPVDPGHPVVKPFGGKPFVHYDEPYVMNRAYARLNFNPMLEMDTSSIRINSAKRKQELEALPRYVAWIKPYKKGRVFFSSPSHNAQSFERPELLGFLLNGMQYTLGDLECEDQPASKNHDQGAMPCCAH